jgi:hypothetical protein
MDTARLIRDLRAEKVRIDRAIAALEALSGSGARSQSPQSAAPAVRKRRKRGVMSAAGRKRISEMMKKRWAARRRAAKKA